MTTRVMGTPPPPKSKAAIENAMSFVNPGYAMPSAVPRNMSRENVKQVLFLRCVDVLEYVCHQNAVP